MAVLGQKALATGACVFGMQRLVLLLLLIAVDHCYSFYLPGVAPIEYAENARVELKVNKLTSAKTQLPYGYYVLPYCRPVEVVESVENLGEILVGDMIENSPYEIQMLRNMSCKVLCKVQLSIEKKDQFRTMIDDEYLVNWIVDNLPAATRYTLGRLGPDGNSEYSYINGFPVGIEKNGHYYVHNHVRLLISYHTQKGEYEGYRVVGFEVEPSSMTQAVRADPNEPKGFQALCQDGAASPLFDLDLHDEIVFTYDVQWAYSEHRWVSRWDNYLKMTGGQIHWFSILNSLMIMLFLSGMVAMILLRTLYRDITRYNELTTAEEAAEETGWKLVHGDVFRRPRHAKLWPYRSVRACKSWACPSSPLFVLSWVSSLQHIVGVCCSQ